MISIATRERSPPTRSSALRTAWILFLRRRTRRSTLNRSARSSKWGASASTCVARSGVATVVLKLLNIVQPSRAYFGEKDAQQLAVIRRMVLDLNVPVTIVDVPTVREADGLALSSRNQHLSAEERCIAPVLIQALRLAQSLIASGVRDAAVVKHEACRVLAEHPDVRVEYIEIVDPEEMQPAGQITAPVRITGAIWVGKTRLIDNLLCVPGASSR